ncbi:MAG: sodium:proton antiporter, partial [Paramuribaculum sp.]|nr:sodium:proton antiporter [Paramuribaculum sp.]
MTKILSKLSIGSSRNLSPTPFMSLMPITWLLGALVTCIITKGADSVLDMSPALLLSAAVICVIITVFFTRRPKKTLLLGIFKAARQIIPAYPLLLLIGMLSSTWMLSGVVPYMINVGMGVLNPTVFLPTACIICAVISVVTGSSWTTIATVGVALMG